MRWLIFTIFFSLTISGISFAQEEGEEKKSGCPQPENKKALDLYKKALDKKKYKKPERLNLLNEAVQLEPDFADAYLYIGNEIIVKCKLDNLPFSSARPYFLNAIRSCPKIHSQPYYYIGFSYYEDAQNDSAVKYLKLFLNFTDDDEKKFSKDYQFEQYQSKEMIKAAKRETELKKKVVPFDPKLLLPLSTKNSEYLPYISPDETVFLFTRAVPDVSIDKVYQSDRDKEIFMISEKQKDGKFDVGKPMEWPFNENKNEGGACLTIDNKHLYYTIFKMEGGSHANADIYFSDIDRDGAWGPITKVPGINEPQYWDSQPSVSADGNTIYFASDRPGGFGKVDIWKTERDLTTKQWKKPVNLGPKINTPGTEKCPFIHSDSETLYFSSDGLYGFGGLDIFYVRKDEKGNWKDPENIGYPINTETDDAGFFVSTDGQYGYFCSDGGVKVRGVGAGKYDVYYFDLYKEARPDEVAFLGGEVKHPDGTPVANAVVEVKNTLTHEKIRAVVDSATGKYVAAVNVKKNKEVVVTVKAPDYSFASQKVELKEVTFAKPPKPVELNIEKAETGKSFVINNILYATGAADLYPESYVTLDEFAEYLKDNPTFKIEIQGHTDNVGKDADNLSLSEKRAANVKKYLETKGIPVTRITSKGYGASKPIGNNATVEGKAQNRRTEFLILGK